MSKKNKHYEDKFKEQIVMLYKSGKNLREISKEYDVPTSTINGWIKLHEKCGSFRLSDSRSESEIIGQAVSNNKDANLVKAAFYSFNGNLNSIHVLHTDRGSEFKNEAIDEIIQTFGITRSLSQKGNPYDNAVAESMYSILKIEFVRG